MAHYSGSLHIDIAACLVLDEMSKYATAKAANKRRDAFSEGMEVVCGGYSGTVLKIGEVKEGMRVDLNMKAYGEPIYDFAVYVQTMYNGKMRKEWWMGSQTRIPRK